LGHYSARKKSIRAEENLFARDSAGDFSATAADNPDEVAGAAMDVASPTTSFTTDAILSTAARRIRSRARFRSNAKLMIAEFPAAGLLLL